MAMPTFMLRLLNLYPPFLGAGIRVGRLEHGYETRLTVRFYNRNYWGTAFGGSLYSMCDPFFVLTLAERLGREYSVWDKAAEIRFLRPGRGTLRARFEVSPERVAEIRAEVGEHGRAEPRFQAEVIDREGEVVARVDKLLSVKRPTSPPPAALPPPSTP